MSAFGEGPFTLVDDLALGAARSAAEDAELRLETLTAVASSRLEPLVRLAGTSPTAAFSRRDALCAGFPAAARVAQRLGFEPVVRPVGGRLAPYHQGCLVLDVIARHPDPRSGTEQRFSRFAGAVAGALTGLGIDARHGPVPGEHCPGKHSVNVAGRTKVAGTAQRVVRGAYLLSAVVVVQDPGPIRALVQEAYPCLGVDVDPGTVGALDDSVPGLGVLDVAAALVPALEQLVGPEHRVSVGASAL